MFEHAVNYGLPPDKQLVFGQMFDYFTDCTLDWVYRELLPRRAFSQG
jgi:hypothetical protein